MKKLLPTRTGLLHATLLAAACLMAAPSTSQARPDRYDHGHHDHRHDDYGRRHFFSRPRSSFTVTFGTGYAGRGYYYGPPGMPYYYQAPGVVYYRSRSVIPSRYVVHEVYRTSSVDASVQRALARRGYYHGPIDGDIGPGSRRAIANYQRARGLHVTGSITPSLLRSLGL